jgi:hypothetical protein
MDVGAGEEIYGDLYDDEGEKDVLLKSKHAAVSCMLSRCHFLVHFSSVTEVM